MERVKPTAESGRAALRAHALARAALARERYGPRLDWPAMQRLLADGLIVRNPVEVCFRAAGLAAGEFACLEPQGERMSAGFRLVIDPRLAEQPQWLPLVVACHLAWVNYGSAAGQQEAELFGAALCGLPPEEYRRRLIELSEFVARPEAPERKGK